MRTRFFGAIAVPLSLILTLTGCLSQGQNRLADRLAEPDVAAVVMHTTNRSNAILGSITRVTVVAADGSYDTFDTPSSSMSPVWNDELLVVPSPTQNIVRSSDQTRVDEFQWEFDIQFAIVPLGDADYLATYNIGNRVGYRLSVDGQLEEGFYPDSYSIFLSRCGDTVYGLNSSYEQQPQGGLYPLTEFVQYYAPDAGAALKTKRQLELPSSWWVDSLYQSTVPCVDGVVTTFGVLFNELGVNPDQPPSNPAAYDFQIDFDHPATLAHFAYVIMQWDSNTNDFSLRYLLNEAGTELWDSERQQIMPRSGEQFSISDGYAYWITVQAEVVQTELSTGRSRVIWAMPVQQKYLVQDSFQVIGDHVVYIKGEDNGDAVLLIYDLQTGALKTELVLPGWYHKTSHLNFSGLAINPDLL